MPMSKPLAVALAFAFRGLAVTTPDETAFVQRSVVKHSDGETPEEAKDAGFQFSVGQRVELEGYGPDRNTTIIGRAHGGRYSLYMEGHGNMLNIEEKYIKKWNTPYPETTDPTAGPVAHVLGFDYKSKPWIVNKGQTPGTWNVYIPGVGLVPNVPDNDIVREKWWYKQGDPKKRSVGGSTAVLVGEMPQTIPHEVVQLGKVAPMVGGDEKAMSLAAAQMFEEPEEVKETPTPKPTKQERIMDSMLKRSEKDKERRTISLQADLKGSFGVTTRLWKGFGADELAEEVLQIEAIAVGGPVDMWNKMHPTKMMKVGDRILSVNGLGGNARTLKKVIEAIELNHVSKGAAVILTKFPPTEFVVESIKKVQRKSGKAMALSLSSKQSASDLKLSNVLGEVVEFAKKGPNQYLREAIPYDLGKVFVNGQAEVNKCSDINSQFLCQTSQEKYKLDCAGWSGAACLAKEDAHCKNFVTASVCQSSKQKFGVECAGWGGSSCLEKGASASLITRESICNSASVRLNSVEAAGWGGDKCLTKTSSCADITIPGICDNSQKKLGMNCLGWGGSSCLAPGAQAELITDETLCKHAPTKFGIEVAGWGGANCLSKEGLTCNKVTDPSACNHAKERLGIECAGWGGSSCLPVGASTLLITSASICQKSQTALGIASAGWSGTNCMPAGPVTCSDITRPGVCNDAAARLGIDCAGWSGDKCFAPGEVKCGDVTGASICKTSMAKFGVKCVWNGEACFPDDGASVSAVAEKTEKTEETEKTDA